MGQFNESALLTQDFLGTFAFRDIRAIVDTAVTFWHRQYGRHGQGHLDGWPSLWRRTLSNCWMRIPLVICSMRMASSARRSGGRIRETGWPIISSLG